MLCVVKALLMFVCVAAARELSDEELHRLPKLFHLDDYDRCLSQKDGLYCVGTFELTPKTTPNAAYELITEKLNHYFSYDRRLLHRGYCLTKRCQSEEQNTTLRFEQCADRLLRKHALTARLKALSYCTTHAERKAKLSAEPDLPQTLFLYVVYFILFLNLVGTVHDVCGDGKKNKYLVAWSISANWKSLTNVNDDTSPFAPVQSCKIILYCIIIYTHGNLIHFMGYVQNPELLEKSRDSFVNILIRNGTSLVQVFILISSFFTGYNTLQTARKSSISAGLTIKWILKRIFRLAPVYLLLTAYSATWWPRAGDGPLWSLVETESGVCRNKFWTHVLFVNNFIQPWDLCMVQSWAIAAEVQLFLVSLLLTLLLTKLKVRAVKVLAAMFVASCLFNVALAYVADLVPMVKVIVPEKLRVEFRGSRSFYHLHISPWSNLPACLFGLLVAHAYFEQKNKHKAKNEGEKEMTNGNNCNVLKHKNGALNNGNVTLVNENYTLLNGNAKKNNGNGALVNGNCSLFNGNGTLVSENSALINENGTFVNGNGRIVNGNFKLVNGNGVHIRNGLYVKKNGVVKENNVVKENVIVEENGVVKENDICIKENGVRFNGIDVHPANEIRHRIHVPNDIKSKNADMIYEKKNNEIIQNGLSRFNGCDNQNVSSLENKYKSEIKRAPFLIRYAHFFTIPVLIVWVLVGSRVAGVDSSPIIALYVGLERLMFSLTFAVQLLQVITIKGPWARLFSWRGWTVLARLVLCVAMVHWCVNLTIHAAKPQPVHSSLLYVSIDWLATLFYSYLIALPLCILVELPMKKAIDAVLS